MKPLGLIAGAGELPRRIIAECAEQARPLFVIGFDGITDASTLQEVEHISLHIAKVGKVIQALRQHNVEEVVMAGRVGRPSPSSLRPDFSGLKLLTRFTRLPSQGDDKVFNAIIAFLEERGFSVIGPDDVLKALLIQDGAFNAIMPDKLAQQDIAIGKRAALAVGELDIGQAVIVQQGQVLGVEGPEGTDRLVARCKDLHKEGPGGVLVKMKKPGQDSRVDLPTIGVYTVENAYASGLRGIAVQAGGALVINREQVKAKADELGLFVVGVNP